MILYMGNLEYMKSNIDKTINLYNSVGWKKYFSKWRFWAAPYTAVEKLVPKKGQILDLGCGEGIFTNYLGISSPSRKITGIELSSERIKEATRGIKNVTFVKADATKKELPKSDGIVLFHLLHHLISFKSQEVLIKKCIKSLKKNGTIVIVEVNIKFSIKYLIAWIFDHFIVPFVFEKKLYSDVFFRSKKNWLILFKKYGLKVKAYDVDSGMPFSHIVFVLKK